MPLPKRTGSRLMQRLRAARRAREAAKTDTGGMKEMTAAQKLAWEETFARAKKMEESGAKEIKSFMNIFDLQLGVLRQQQPRPDLQGLVDKLKESVSRARVYLSREMPYGITEQQWSSLRETMGHAEETIDRYEAAIEEMQRLAQQEAEVQQVEQAAGIQPTAPAPGAPTANGAAPAPAAPPAAANGLAPPIAVPQAQVAAETAPAELPPRGFPTGLVIGGVALTGLVVGGVILVKKRGKKKGK